MLSHILERRRFNSLRASSLGDKRSRDRYNVELILRCIGLCFSYHLYLLSRSDQQLIQRIPAGLSSTVVALLGQARKDWGGRGGRAFLPPRPNPLAAHYARRSRYPSAADLKEGLLAG